MMTPERWQKVRDILEQALELAPEKRARFLDLACSSDPSLRDEVDSFLAASDNAPERFLEDPPVASASFHPGARIDDYEIVSQIGMGGMGVVYEARDLALGRLVAIKVLRTHLATDPSRLRQFEQEAKAAAALNHPHILAVYQLGVYRGAPYLVSELLKGETLRDQLSRGPIVRSKSLEFAEQIADGLSAAHQRGIIHRDLKPENLFVSEESRIKILDFGLAKLLEQNKETAALLSTVTRTGGIAGTIAYASPEQVRGEKLEMRTDLFSFGIVLYEMTTGQRPFSGETSGVVFDAILNRQPVPPSQLSPAVSPELERIITKALEKDRDVRYQSAVDIRADLKRLRRDTDSGHNMAARAHQAPEKPAAPNRRLLKWAAAVSLFIIIAWLAYPLAKTVLYPHRPPLKNLHAQIDPPPTHSFRMFGDNAGPPVISPNGDYLAFTATGRDGKYKLWVRALNSVDARPLPETDGASFPFWSNDSNSLGFFADGKLKTINVSLGSPVSLCEASDGRGGAWGDGSILFAPTPTSPLFLVKTTGGVPEPVTKIEEKHTTHRWPSFLPDKRHFVYLAANHEPSKASDNMVYYASLDGSENRPLFHAETSAIFADGFLLSVSGDNLMARAFDLVRNQVVGEPVLVARRTINDSVTWHADLSVSDAGTLVYGGSGEGSRQLVWLDSKTYAQTGVAVDGLLQLFLMDLSPQGDRVVVQKDQEGHDFSVFDLREKTTLSSLPKLNGNMFPIWSPDGRWIAYSSFRDGRYHIYRTPADGSGDEQEILSDDLRVSPTDWRGDTFLYFRGGLGNEFECWKFSLTSRRKQKVLDNIDDCRLSPDQHWLAYAARENVPPGSSQGPLKVYVMNLLTGRAKYQVSEGSGEGPRWSHDGKDLYYLEQTTLSLVRMSVDLSGPVPHFHVVGNSGPNILSQPTYAVSPDQKRILTERIPEPTVVVVTNFADGLEEK